MPRTRSVACRGDRDDQLGRAVPLLAAVVGQEVGLRGAGIERIVRRRRVDRVVVQPAGDVHRGDEPDAAGDRPAGPERGAVEPVVERAAERPVGLDARRGPPTTRRDRG